MNYEAHIEREEGGRLKNTQTRKKGGFAALVPSYLSTQRYI